MRTKDQKDQKKTRGSERVEKVINIASRRRQQVFNDDVWSHTALQVPSMKKCP
jgi:hypothetical protein